MSDYYAIQDMVIMGKQYLVGDKIPDVPADIIEQMLEAQFISEGQA